MAKSLGPLMGTRCPMDSHEEVFNITITMKYLLSECAHGLVCEIKIKHMKIDCSKQAPVMHLCNLPEDLFYLETHLKWILNL